MHAVKKIEADSADETKRRDLLVDSRLGDYVIRRRIGAGGMSVVYEGLHEVLNRKVAIKLFRPDYHDAGEARGLLSEARTSSSIRHRNIIDVFDFGKAEGFGEYLVMEYLDGDPLDVVIADRAPLHFREVVEILDQILAGLEAAHAEGVIHRDLKPSNIFVARESSGTRCVKILDFGLAKKSTTRSMGSPADTRMSALIGTPDYMAPEQALAGKVGPRTDLYAVGVTAYEMITGKLPFTGKSPLDVAMAHVKKPPPRPSQHVWVPPILEDLILRMLAKEPADRPQSAESVRRELLKISREQPVTAAEESPPEAYNASTDQQETQLGRPYQFDEKMPKRPSERHANPLVPLFSGDVMNTPAPLSALPPRDDTSTQQTLLNVAAMNFGLPGRRRRRRQILLATGAAMAIAALGLAAYYLIP